MNSLTRMPQSQIVDPAQQWFWNGSQWVCGCDPDPGCPPPFPPTAPPWFPPPPTQPPWYPGANGSVSFSPTQPPNPIRGALWWDGATLHLFDGAAWVPVGGESGGGGTPPSTTPPANPSNGQQWFNGTTLFVWDGVAWVPVAGTKTTISATAPPSPNPGDLWFDGTQLRIWSGNTWNLVGPGATVGPVPTTTEVFRLVASSAITIPGGSGIVPFTVTPQVDTQGMWDPTTHKIMPKVPGIYFWHITGYYGGAGNSGGDIALLMNDTGVFDLTSVRSICLAGLGDVPDTIGIYMADSGMVRMNGTTDFVRFFAAMGPAIQQYFPVNTTVPCVQGWLMP